MAQLTSLLFFLTVCFKGIYCIWPCPEEEDIVPCTCESDTETYQLYIDCSDANDDSELSDAFAAQMPFFDYEELEIIKTTNDSSNLDRIEYGMFGEAYFKKIRIEGTTFTTLLDDALLYSEKSLVSLMLSNNNFKSFIFEALPYYTELENLDLTFNDFSSGYISVPIIKSDSLVSLDLCHNGPWKIADVNTFLCPKLNILHMAYLSLDTTPPGLFSDLPLQELQMSGNNFFILREGQISSNSSIVDLSLSNSNIRTIEPNSINNLDPYGKIDLSNNKIEDLEEDNWSHVFSQLLQTQSINLTGNPLLCGCNMAWLFPLDHHSVSKLTHDTTCRDGTNIHTLDPVFFETICPE